MKSIAAVFLTIVAGAVRCSPAPEEAPASRPRLAVVCVVDQMRGDYLDKFDRAFGGGGFRRLRREGTHFTNCHFPYAETETGPGHTSIGTGRLPRHTGIVANDWYDRALGRSVYCIEDPSVKLIGPNGAAGNAGRSARNLRGETFSDVLRPTPESKSKVFSISVKDRAAIPMGGRHPNGVFWFHPPAGSFVTSTAFAERVPEWLSAFTRSHPLSSMPRLWDRFLPEDAYAPLGLDDQPWEQPGSDMGRVFPHPLFKGAKASAHWEAVMRSAASMPLLTDLAIEILNRERLGRGAAVDLLWVSYSATDYCGHDFGPGSHELFDAYARVDREIERLLTALDQAVGKGNYVFALTSDHGACEVPEREIAAGRPGGRVAIGVDKDGRPTGFLAEIENAFSAAVDRHPSKRWTAAASQSGLVFSEAALREAGIDLPKACQVMRGVLRAHPVVAAAYTQSEIEARAFEADDAFARAFANGNDRERSDDVHFVLRFGWLATTSASSHGTPHPYDTSVPLLILGGGAAGTVRPERVTPLDLVPSLAALLDVRAPEGCDGTVLPGLGP